MSAFLRVRSRQARAAFSAPNANAQRRVSNHAGNKPRDGTTKKGSKKKARERERDHGCLESFKDNETL